MNSFYSINIIILIHIAIIMGSVIWRYNTDDAWP